MKTLTNKWYEEVRQGPSGSEDDDDEAELLWQEYFAHEKVYTVLHKKWKWELNIPPVWGGQQGG